MINFLLLLFSPLFLYAQLSYPERLQAIEEMAETVPGHALLGKDLGALGGIYVQTEWQLRTGRDKIRSWNKINFWLTVVPYEFFQNWLNEVPCSGSLCVIWKDYFDFTDNRERIRQPLVHSLKARRMLWAAHKASIEHALALQPKLIESDSIPTAEKRYLKGWIRFVHVLSRSQMPTGERFVRVLASPTGPNCSPLGAHHCRVEDLPLITRVFVSQMISLSELEGQALDQEAYSIVQSMSTTMSP